MKMESKTCTKCGASKLFSEFHNSNKSKDGKRPVCKECRKSEDPGANERAKRYYLNNRDKVLCTVKEYTKRRPDVVAKAQKNWLEKNGFVYQKKWKIGNPGKVNALTAKRRKLCVIATPSWANFSEIEKFYLEARRMTEETGISYQVDHMVPLFGKTVCGLHCESNLQILAGSENAKKSNRHWPDMP